MKKKWSNMSDSMYVIMFALAVLAKGQMTLAEHSVRMTLHTQKVTWNEAWYICEAENMSLVIDDWLERTNVIVYFLNNTWPPLIHPWIGLHYASTSTGGPEQWVWPDCVLQNLTIYSNWALFEPLAPCVYYDLSDEKWSTENCFEEFEFICEKTEGPCTFQEVGGSPELSLYYQYQYQSASNYSECQSICLFKVHSDRNCWAAFWDGVDCKLYFTRDPFLFDSLSFAGGGSTFIKRCYSSAIDTVNDTPYDMNNKQDPENICPHFSKHRHDHNPGDNTTTTVTVSSTTSTGASPASNQPPTLAPITTTSQPSTTNTDTTTSGVTVSGSTAPTTTKTTSGSTTSTTNAPISGSGAQTTSTTTTTSSTTASLTSAAISGSTTPTSISTINPSASSSALTVSSSSISGSLASSAGFSSTATVIISTTSTAPTSQSNSNAGFSSSVTAFVTSTNPNTSTNQSACKCPCSNTTSSSNLTLVEKLEQIITKLKVDKKKLSSTLRKKKSAEDERTSAKSVGYVAILVAALELSVIFVPDLIKLIQYFYFEFVG